MLHLRQYPVIAAVCSAAELREAAASPVEAIFLLNADILHLERMIADAARGGKKVYVHVDLTEGLGRDYAGLAYLARLGADGVVSTKTGLIRIAKELKLETVQRFFIVDTHSIDTAVETASQVHPDMVELMPGLVPKAVRRISAALPMPVIAGGLIETQREVAGALQAGASAISTTKALLWKNAGVFAGRSEEHV